MSFKIHIFGKLKHRHFILKSQLNKPTKLDHAIPQPRGRKRTVPTAPLCSATLLDPISSQGFWLSCSSLCSQLARPAFPGPLPRTRDQEAWLCLLYVSPSLGTWEKALNLSDLLFSYPWKGDNDGPQAPGWPCRGIMGVSTCRQPSPCTLVTSTPLCANAIAQ